MKLKPFILTVCAVLLTCQIQIKAQKIYLSPSGSDNNPGSLERPFASLNRALDRARELLKANNRNQQVEIIALEGEYFMMQPLVLTQYDGGTSENPLIIKAEPDTRAIFRGGVEVTGFEKINDNLWRAFVPQVAWYDSYFEQLYVNGRRAVRARSPNDGFHKVTNVSESVIEKGEGRFPKLAIQQIELDPSDTMDLNTFSKQDFRDALIVFYHNWDNTRKRITGYSSNKSSVFLTGEGMKPWNPINSKSRYFLENYRAALDVPGEWYLDRSGYLYYIPLKGETIENSRFLAPVIKEFISIEGNHEKGQRVSNIVFDNLIFEVAGYKTPPEGNEPAQAAAPVDAVIYADFAGDIEFRNCEISHTGTYAFWFRRSCTNCLVTRCYLHDLGAGGVKIGETIIRPGNEELTKNIVIDNNIIRDAGHVFPCAVGIIIFNASDNSLTHNEITDLRYSGISVGWVWGYAFSPSKRNRIAYNHIHHLGWGELSDMGGVYTLGASEGTVVNNNLIHHIYSFDYGGWGLYTDEGSYDIIMENNLVYACKNSGFHQHYGKENIIRNNIFALNIRAQLQATRIEEHRSLSFTNNIIYFNSGTLLSSNWDKFNLVTDNNCYWDTRIKDILFSKKSFSEWRKEGKDIHSVIRNPLFVNPESFDFHFRNLSVARKIGFKPFDYTEAGVYGSDAWKDLARFDKAKSEYFDERVRSLEGENR